MGRGERKEVEPEREGEHGSTRGFERDWGFERKSRDERREAERKWDRVIRTRTREIEPLVF